jgi:predicted Zn-dependent protease
MDRIAAFQEILAQDPRNAFARYGLAMEHRQRGENPQALAEFDALEQQQPDYVPGYQMAAQLLLSLGRNDEARSRLERGLAAAQRTGNRHAVSEMEDMLEEIQEA